MKLATSSSNPERRRADLTEREKRILRLLCDGVTNDEIAGRLALPLDVVQSSLQRIFRKIDAGRRSRAAVAFWNDRLHGDRHL